MKVRGLSQIITSSYFPFLKIFKTTHNWKNIIKKISISQVQIYHYNGGNKNTTILLSTTRRKDNYYTLKYDNTRFSASGQPCVLEFTSYICCKFAVSWNRHEYSVWLNSRQIHLIKRHFLKIRDTILKIFFLESQVKRDNPE